MFSLLVAAEAVLDSRPSLLLGVVVVVVLVKAVWAARTGRNASGNWGNEHKKRRQKIADSGGRDEDNLMPLLCLFITMLVLGVRYGTGWLLSNFAGSVVQASCLSLASF